VRIFGPIVSAQTLFMVADKTEIAQRRSIRPKFVGHDRPWRKALPFQQFSQQSQRGGCARAQLRCGAGVGAGVTDLDQKSPFIFNTMRMTLSPPVR
jgi:hypothetical protein